MRTLFDTAAAISVVMPGADPQKGALVGLFAQQPVAKALNDQVANPGECRGIDLVDDQARHLVPLVGTTTSFRKVVSGRSAAANCAATRSSAQPTATSAK
jgi:hypothetical protein